MNVSFKTYLDDYVKGQGWSGTNAQRAQYLVDILAKAAYDYLGEAVDLNDWQTVTRRFKGNHTLSFLQAARQAMRPDVLAGHKKQLMQIAGLMEEMGGDTYQGYVQNIKATFSSKGYRTAQYNQWLNQTDALNAFAQGLLGYYDDVKNFRVKMWQTGITASRMAELMGGLPDLALQSLTAAERLQALQVLSRGDLKDKWLFYGNNAENLAIALLRTAPVGQAAEMHQGFTAASYALLAAMWPKVHDEGVGNLNYTAFVGQLCRFYYGRGSQVVQQAAKALPEDRLINWGSSLLKVRNYSVDDKNLGQMVFTSTRTDIRFKVGPDTQGVYQTTAEPDVRAAAFEEIGIVMLAEPDQNLFPGAQKGQVYPVPALYFAYLVDKDHTDDLKQAIFGTLNMASFAIGIGELMTAKNALQVAWALANVAPPVVDLVLNTPEINGRIRQWEGGEAFLSAWTKVRTITEVVLITKATIDVGRGFVLSFNKIKGRLQADPGISLARYREMEAEVARVRQQCEGVGACFMAGTLVATAEGLLPIECIRPGQKVQARDVFTGQTGYGRVRRRFVRQASQLVRLFVGSTLIEATPEHPFYVEDHWLAAGQLQKGDRLTLAEGNVTASLAGDDLAPATAQVDSIAYLDTLVTVYNLEVAGFHTYFVGQQGVLVHNDCEDLLDGAGDVVKGVSEGKWLDDLETLLGAGTKTKINGWIEQGLDADKLKLAFEKAAGKSDLLNKLATAKSVYHQRVYVEDWDNIPGVSKTNYEPNGLSVGKSHIKWNNPALDLPAAEAANFVEATAVELQQGTRIYRVTGGNPAGGYWTIQKPNSVGEVIGGTAVQPAWNNFQRMYMYEVPKGSTLKVWQGTTAKQPITQNVVNPHLPGGDQQIFIPEVIRDEAFKNAVQQIPLTW